MNKLARLGRETDDSAAIEIVDRLRDEAALLGDHVDSLSVILGDRFELLSASQELQQQARRVALQRYASAREDWQRLLSMLGQAEDRLATESKVFTAVDDFTRL